MLRARVPIEELVDDPSADASLRERLRLVQSALAFAERELALPSEGSYRHYADLGRPYVLWNLYATPEFSLQPLQWCYPLLGCLAYRGYYALEAAREAAARLRADGRDVYIGGVPAYSTLGWFDDPVLNTMLGWNDRQLVGTLLHELAHQRVFVRDDTAFNESFASFVEEEGLRRWLAARGECRASLDLPRRRHADFVALIEATRERLQALYARPLPPQEMRQAKQQLLAQLRQQYRELRDGPWAGYDSWFAQPLNNAALLPVALYNAWTPAFAQLFADCGRQWQRFYAAVRELAALDGAARERRLQALMRRAESADAA